MGVDIGKSELIKPEDMPVGQRKQARIDAIPLKNCISGGTRERALDEKGLSDRGGAGTDGEEFPKLTKDEKIAVDNTVIAMLGEFDPLVSKVETERYKNLSDGEKEQYKVDSVNRLVELDKNLREDVANNKKVEQAIYDERNAKILKEVASAPLEVLKGLFELFLAEGNDARIGIFIMSCLISVVQYPFKKAEDRALDIQNRLGGDELRALNAKYAKRDGRPLFDGEVGNPVNNKPRPVRVSPEIDPNKDGVLETDAAGGVKPVDPNNSHNSIGRG